MKHKYQAIIKNNHTEKIAFLARTINFLEDVLEDAECEEILIDSHELENYTVIVDGIKCRYDLLESINVFSEKHNVPATIGKGDTSLRTLYEEIIDYYRETLHYKMKEYATKTIATRHEYYLGILFNGKAFLIEGEEDKVLLPRIPQCLSAHTHPSNIPIPSKQDLKTVTQLFTDRGIGHIIETIGASLAIYRVAPITIDDLEIFKQLENTNDIIKALNNLTKKTPIRLRYI